MKISGINFTNNKGAIIVGENGSGKSRILNKIRESSKKKKSKEGIEMRKIEIQYEDNKSKEKDFIFIDSSTILDDSFKGAKSSIETKLKKVQKDITSEVSQPKDLFNDNILKKYEKSLEYSISSFKKENIFETNMNLTFESKIKTNDLVSADLIINFEGIDYNLKDASTGMKALIGIFLKSDEIKDSVIAIDEIEKFLHPEWIFLASKLISKLYNDNIVILTTHNPILLSSLLKEKPELLSIIEKSTINDFGVVKTIDYDKLKNNVKDILNIKNVIFKLIKRNKNNKDINNKYINDFGDLKTMDHDKLKNNVKDILNLNSIENKYNENTADKYIKSTINQETAMMFFWNKPIFVEGPTEKIFLEQVKLRPFISTGGFHQFIIIAEILKSIDKKAKFIMDRDAYKNGDTKEYNEYVYNEINKNDLFDIYRFKSNFDFLLSGEKKMEGYEKVPNAIDKINNSPLKDPNNELDSLYNFIDDIK